MIGLLLSALNPFKMILFWGLKKIPLFLEIPTLKDHLTLFAGSSKHNISKMSLSSRGNEDEEYLTLSDYEFHDAEGDVHTHGGAEAGEFGRRGNGFADAALMMPSS